MSDVHLDIAQYISDRVEDQLTYFDANAMKNQKYFRLIKTIQIVSNITTSILIGLAFIYSTYITELALAAFFSSIVVLATYQWEEFQNYGAKWEKFRLVAENLKSEKFLFLTGSAQYKNLDKVNSCLIFVERIENIIKNTDISYFSLLVEPGQRIEKRLSAINENLIEQNNRIVVKEK